MGASKNTNLMGWDKIWAFNKAVIDPSVPRYTALLADGLVPLSLEGAPPAPFAETMATRPRRDASTATGRGGADRAAAVPL